MRTEYKKDVHRSYMIVHMDHQEKHYAYPWKMVTENEIPGLLHCEYRMIDQEIMLYYDITSKLSLKERCNGRKITGEEAGDLIESLMVLLKAMEEYLLPEEGLCLDENYIYADALGKEVSFCYIPEAKGNLEDNIRNLLEYLLTVLDHGDHKNVTGIYELYQSVVNKEFSMENWEERIHKTIYEQKENKKNELPKELIYTDTVYETGEEEEREKLLDEFFLTDDPEEKGEKTLITIGAVGVIVYLLAGWYLIKNYPAGLWIWACAGIITGAAILIYYKKAGKLKQEESLNRFSEKIKEEQDLWDDLQEKEEILYTQMLVREPVEYCLVGINNESGTKIQFTDREVQFLGHLKDHIDIFLSSSAVSRVHAKIRKKEGEYFLSDLNSKNGTWVNGEELYGDREVKLKEGDIIRFADMEYSFKNGG